MVIDVETEDGLALGEPKLLFEKPNAFSRYDVAPEGQRLVMIEQGESQPAPTQLASSPLTDMTMFRDELASDPERLRCFEQRKYRVSRKVCECDMSWKGAYAKRTIYKRGQVVRLAFNFLLRLDALIGSIATAVAFWIVTPPTQKRVTRTVIPLSPSSGNLRTNTYSIAISPYGEYVAYIAG